MQCILFVRDVVRASNLQSPIHHFKYIQYITHLNIFQNRKKNKNNDKSNIRKTKRIKRQSPFSSFARRIIMPSNTTNPPFISTLFDGILLCVNIYFMSTTNIFPPIFLPQNRTSMEQKSFLTFELYTHTHRLQSCSFSEATFSVGCEQQFTVSVCCRVSVVAGRWIKRYFGRGRKNIRSKKPLKDI